MLRSTVLFAAIIKFDTVSMYLNINVKPIERDQEFPRLHLECGHGDE